MRGFKNVNFALAIKRFILKLFHFKLIMDLVYAHFSSSKQDLFVLIDLHINFNLFHFKLIIGLVFAHFSSFKQD
jgi:hypothetical protein